MNLVILIAHKNNIGKLYLCCPSKTKDINIKYKILKNNIDSI